MSIEITGSMELITPKEAAWILENKNPGNRPLRPNTVAQYAREMKEGHWHSGVTDAIGFTTGGLLVNGQHRLSAVVDAGIAVRFFVARNVPADAFAYMDIGARRSISDRTKLDRHQSDVVTALLRVLGGGGHVASDPEEVLRTHAVFSSQIDLVLADKTRAKGATACMRAAIVMLLAEGGDQTTLLNQYTAFIHDTEAMSEPVRSLHRRLNGGRSRIGSTDRELVFAESINSFGNREEKMRVIIGEYRRKFEQLMAKGF